MKLAHIRVATRQEIQKFFPPTVCVGPDGLYYVFNLRNRVVLDHSNKIVARLPFGWKERRYAFSDGTSLLAKNGPTGLSIDGRLPSERWITPSKRVFEVSGRMFLVKPEDDSIMFEFDGEKPPLDMTVAAYLIRPLAGSGGDVSV